MRKSLSISVLLQLITTVVVVALAATLATSAYNAFERRETANRVRSVVEISRDLFLAMQVLRVERGTINTALETPDPLDSDTQATVAGLRLQSQQALDSALVSLDASSIPGTDTAVNKIRRARQDFIRLRREADEVLGRAKSMRPSDVSARWIKAGARLVDAINELSERMSGDISQAPAFIGEMIKIKQLGWVARDAAGIQRLLVGAAIASETALSSDRRKRYAFEAGRVDGAWQLIAEDMLRPEAPSKLRETVAAANRTYFDDIRAIQNKIIDELTLGNSLSISGQEWMMVSNPGLESIMLVPNTAFDLAEAEANKEAGSAERDFYSAVFQVALFVLIGALIILIIVRPLVRRIAEITETTRSLASGDLAGDIPFVHRGDEIGQLARAVRDAQRELVKKERLSALGHLTATVAHELRNPLSAIRNTLFSLKEIARDQGASFDRPIARMERSVLRCERIISDLLDFTRSRELKLHTVSLDRWVDEVLAEYSVPNGIVLERLSTAPGAMVALDEERFRRVLINLIDNAAQAIRNEEGVEGRIIVRTTGFPLPEIVVEDTGTGISPDILPKIFEPLFSTKSFGTGLGLPTVKQIVEQHGGSVSVDSEVGKRTWVSVRLPLALAENVAA